MREKWGRLLHAGNLLLLLLAAACVLCVSGKSQQSVHMVPMPQSFAGEYSYDGNAWLPLTDDAELSASRGDVYLRGHFERDLPQGCVLRYYRNHIGVIVYVNGELVFIDAVAELSQGNRQVLSSMCGQEWAGFLSGGITADDQVEIHLKNPHRMGNESAYRDFLDSLCGDMGDMAWLAMSLKPYGAPFRVTGRVLAIAALMILGAAAAAAIARMKESLLLIRRGFLTLFAGGYIYLDTIDLSLHSELLVLNTSGKQLCLMLGMFFMGQLLYEGLSGKRRAAVKAAIGLSALVNAGIIISVMAGWRVIFDTLPWWLLSQAVICLVLVVCCVQEMRHTPPGKWLMPGSFMLLVLGAALDSCGNLGCIWWRNPVTKALFVLLFAVHALHGFRFILINQRASIRAERLEKELENNRISIMLSQIQPHFLYNVLGTIRGLCREDPMMARQALGDFSDYLRSNMNALTNRDTIHFDSELRHVEAYLRLEKMRMGEKLNICLDIHERDFLLPPLTIQPLVENAVKHGLFEKGGGTLTLRTYREKDRIVISVQDDGVGFDPAAPVKKDDQHTHVGLANVRNRLEKHAGGKLFIDSAPGRGTTVTVLLDGALQEDGGRGPSEHTGN